MKSSSQKPPEIIRFLSAQYGTRQDIVDLAVRSGQGDLIGDIPSRAKATQIWTQIWHTSQIGGALKFDRLVETALEKDSPESADLIAYVEGLPAGKAREQADHLPPAGVNVQPEKAKSKARTDAKPRPAPESRHVASLAGPLVRLVNQALGQASNLLWQGVHLRDFEEIVPRVKIVEAPFKGAASDPATNTEATTALKTDEPQPLREFLSRFFRQDWNYFGAEGVESGALSVVFLTGDAGIGKSASLKILASDWPRQDSSVLPIYIQFTDLLVPIPGELRVNLNLLLQRIAGTNVPTLEARRDEDPIKTVILFLDAFDEAALQRGESRATLLNAVFRYCKPLLQFEDGGLDQGLRVRGIVIASRERLSYSERQILPGATVVSLQPFNRADVSTWLRVFNRRAVALQPGDVQLRPLGKDSQISEEMFWYQGAASGKRPVLEFLADVVQTPLYLYLLACIHAVDFRGVRQFVSGLRETPLTAIEAARRKRFSIINHFFGAAAQNYFLGVGAFREAATGITIAADPRNVLRRIGELAGESPSREFSLDEEQAAWAKRALPLEDASGGDEELWRFPHLSLVEFLLAEGLVSKLREAAEKPIQNWPGEPEKWWRNQDPALRRVTIAAGKLTISDRAFDFIEQHLLELLPRQRGTTEVRHIADIAETWATLNATIVPLGDVEERCPDGEYLVCKRQQDIGLRITNLGLPLLGCCRRVLGQEFQQPPDSGDDRHYLRQYVRLASFVVDSGFANRSDVNRLPLRRLISNNSSFEGVDMMGLDLEDGKLSGAELQQAYLLGANLRGIVIDGRCNLRDSNFVGADLQRAVFASDMKVEGVTLYRANLQEATLEGVELKYCNMVGANLKGVNLRGARLIECVLSEADLRGACLEGATLERSILIAAQIQGANFSSAKIKEGVWFALALSDAETIFKDASFASLIGLSDEYREILKVKGANVLDEDAPAMDTN